MADHPTPAPAQEAVAERPRRRLAELFQPDDFDGEDLDPDVEPTEVASQLLPHTEAQFEELTNAGIYDDAIGAVEKALSSTRSAAKQKDIAEQRWHAEARRFQTASKAYEAAKERYALSCDEALAAYNAWQASRTASEAPVVL